MSDWDNTERIDYDDLGDLDDIAVGNVELFRMERMSASCFWLRLHRAGGRDIVFWLNAVPNDRKVPRDNAPYKIAGSHEHD